MATPTRRHSKVWYDRNTACFKNEYSEVVKELNEDRNMKYDDLNERRWGIGRDLEKRCRTSNRSIKVSIPSNATLIEHNGSIDELIRKLNNTDLIKGSGSLYEQFFLKDRDQILAYTQDGHDFVIYKKDSRIGFWYSPSSKNTSYDYVNLRITGSSDKQHNSLYPSDDVKDILHKLVPKIQHSKLKLISSHIRCPSCKKKAQQTESLSLFFCKKCSLSGNKFNLKTEEFIS